MDNYLSPKEIASRLSLSPKTVYQAIDRGELQAHRFGRVLRVSPDALGDWLERSVA